MVLKLRTQRRLQTASFENDVKMYGTQATTQWKNAADRFENDVKMYGTQANRD